jgi:hypothetical protein
MKLYFISLINSPRDTMAENNGNSPINKTIISSALAHLGLAYMAIRKMLKEQNSGVTSNTFIGTCEVGSHPIFHLSKNTTGQSPKKPHGIFHS